MVRGPNEEIDVKVLCNLSQVVCVISFIEKPVECSLFSKATSFNLSQGVVSW